MSKVLVYTSPALGHVYPIIPTLKELTTRGHRVSVRTLGAEVERLRRLGFTAEPIDAAIEARQIDDWKASSSAMSLVAACQTFVDRGQHELVDLKRAIEHEQPDVLFIDVNCWGAAAVAEASGLKWALFAPYFLPLRAPGVPPWGMGLSPMRNVVGRARDAALWAVVNRLYDRALKPLNALRASAGVSAFEHVADFTTRAPRIVAYTAEPFEYARAWPSSVRLVGPGIWEPEGSAVPEKKDERPLILVTCSTEFQNDGRIVEATLAALANEPVRVVATTASVDPSRFTVPRNAVVERFLPHGPLLAHAACVVCHGGMGITQKALSAGVPVCVIPFGRDQIEVGKHVEVANAGVRLLPKELTPARVRQAIERAMRCVDGAKRVAAAFRQAGGAQAAADALETLGLAAKAPRADVARSA